MKKREYVRLLRKFLLIFISSTAASFLTIILIQSLMGGVKDIQQIMVRSVMIGISLGLITFVSPQKRKNYPWL